MKKILVFLLIAILLTGCAPLQQLPPTEATELQFEPATMPEPETEGPTEQETEPKPAITQLPMVAVSVPHTIETITSDNGDVIFRKTTQSMHLTMQDPDVADKIILDFLNRVDRLSADEAYAREAAENANSTGSYQEAYFFDLIYNPTRIDYSVMSLTGESVSYSGSSHPSRTCVAANYNMVTGDVLTLGSILYHIDAKDTLTDLVIQHLASISEDKHLFNGFEDTVRRRFNRDESFDEDWYFSTNGLCFYFAPYEIAPYASGIIVAEIPYSELAGVIADEFFPPEEDVVNGDISFTFIDDANMDQFSQIAEINIDTNGDMILLYTTGAVRNVQLISESDNINTLFATYTLTPGDAIMIKINTEEESTPLRLSYESGGELQTIILDTNFFD